MFPSWESCWDVQQLDQELPALGKVTQPGVAATKEQSKAGILLPEFKDPFPAPPQPLKRTWWRT